MSGGSGGSGEWGVEGVEGGGDSLITSTTFSGIALSQVSGVKKIALVPVISSLGFFNSIRTVETLARPGPKGSIQLLSMLDLTMASTSLVATDPLLATSHTHIIALLGLKK